jgi:hypothetical protein
MTKEQNRPRLPWPIFKETLLNTACPRGGQQGLLIQAARFALSNFVLIPIRQSLNYQIFTMNATEKT